MWHKSSNHGSSGCMDLFLFLKLWWKVLDDEVVCLHILQHIRMSTALLAQF
jgi:hypothetical protein